MPHSLQVRVEAVRRQASRLLWLFGLARFAAATIGLVILLCLVDYTLRLHDPNLRWLLTAAAVAGSGAAFVWLTWPVLGVRHGSIEIARRIEARFPSLNERLSSAMAFLGQSEHDPTAGSPALRKAVVAEAESLAAGLDFRAALDSRVPRQVAILAALACALAAFLAVMNPAAANRALARLAMPWRDMPWPRQHELAFVDPTARLATGDDLELAIVDRRGKLPDNVRLQLRLTTADGTRLETHDMQPLGERMVYRLGNVTRTLEYRAAGGDDNTMPWITLEVLEPPQVVELTVEVTPPTYTQRSPREEGRVVKALHGSHVQVRGRLDKPIAQAAVRSETPGLALPPVSISADGLSFAAPADRAGWTVERSGAFWIECIDAHGLAFGRDTRVELQVVPDSAPAIAWETPADHTFVTPHAIVPVQALVKDDLAIRGVQLRFLRPGASETEQVIELYVARSGGPPAAEGEPQTIDYGWDLAKLPGLQPGDVLAVRLTAEDFKPQLATSVARRLTIVTEEELENRALQRQSAVLTQLAEALRVARQCREQTAAIEIRLTEVGRLEAGDLNHLQSAQLNQRQLEKLLGTGAEGVEGQLLALLEELAANRVGSEAAATRLQQLLEQVRTLNAGPLPAIEQELTQAFKSAREVVDAGGDQKQSPQAVVSRLQTTGQKQDEVVQALESMLGTLAEWDSFSRLAREIGAIRSDQTQLAEETETQRLALVAAAGDMPPAEVRTAARLAAQRELELARRLDKLQSRMEEMLTRLEASDPLAAGTLADALDVARRQAIGGQLREAAARLNALQFGQAQQTQAAVLSGLKQLLDTLSSRRGGELKRSVAALKAAAGELGDLLNQSRQTQAALDAAAAEPDATKRERELQRLTRELVQLADEIDKLRRQLQRLRAEQPAQSLGQAAGKSGAAAQASAENNAPDAQQAGRETQRLLEEAQAQLAEQVAQAEEELAREELARVEQFISGLAARQKNVLTETQRLDGLRQAGELAAEQQAALRNVAAEQRLLADETDQLRPQLAAAKAFDLAIDGIVERMREAAALLQRGETGAAAQSPEQAALARLEQMLAALKPDEPTAGAEPPPGQEQPPPGAGQPPPGNLAGMMAELKLLKLLQEEIQARTSDLEAARAGGGALTPAQEQELDRLAREQGRLADMVLDLIESAAERPENDPDSLPEVRPEGNKPAAPDAKPTLDEQLLRDLEVK